MAPLCGSCGTACAASDQRCPACGRVLAASNTATALLAGASGQPNGHVIPQRHIIALALFACCVMLAVGVGVWFFAFAPTGFGPHAPPLILTATPPTLDQPAVSPGVRTPSTIPAAAPSATTTSGGQGSGGGGAPTATATVPIAATVTATHAPPTPSPVAATATAATATNTPVPPVPTATNTPVSGGG